MRKRYKWTDVELDYLRELAKENKYIFEITELMSNKFNHEFRKSQIKSIMAKYKITNNMKSKKPKGIKTWNKGLNMGNAHIHNLKNIGDEYVNSDGVITIKVDNPVRWVHKHRYIYEQAFGEIPKDKVLIFLDGNKQNLNLDNLCLISKRQLLSMNQNKLFYNNAELTKVGSELANLMLKINEVSKNKKIRGNSYV